MSKYNENNKTNDPEYVRDRTPFLANKHPIDNQAENPYKDEFDILKTDTTFDSLEFPLDIFPKNIINIIEQLDEKMNFQPQTTAAGILFTVSTVIGSSRLLHIKNGWDANACLWLNIVGETGTTKSHPINWTLKPLQELETDFYSTHKVEAKKYALSNSKKNKENNADAPTRERRYVTNATTEGLVRTLEENPTKLILFDNFFRFPNLDIFLNFVIVPSFAIVFRSLSMVIKLRSADCVNWIITLDENGFPGCSFSIFNIFFSRK
jgi:hypothetical protein